MEERVACALLKQRFEAAGFTIEDNRPFDEDGVRFEIDGFDPRHRVGYEYATDEAGDSWDVDDAVIAALGERHRRGEVHVLVLREADAPDAETLGRAADTFLAELRERGVGATKPADTAKSEPAQTIAIPEVAPSEPAQAIAVLEAVSATEAAERARRSDPEGVQAERGAESVPSRASTEPDAPTTPAGKSRAKKAPRASTSKPKSSNPKPPPAGKKSASKKSTRK